MAKLRSTLDACLAAPKALAGEPQELFALGTYFLTSTVQITNDFIATWKTNKISDARMREVALFDAMYNFIKSCESDVSKFAIPPGTAQPSDFRSRMSDGISRVVRTATYQTKACDARIICGPNSRESLTCTVANGSGAQTRTCSADGQAWNVGACGVASCNSGYVLSGTNCIQMTPPSLSTATLPSSASTTARTYFAGSVTDSRGLSGVSVVVSGPRGSNITAFTDAKLSGTSKALSGYFFDAANSQYAGAPGTYSVTLSARNIAGQSTSRTFTISIVDSAPSLVTAGLASVASRSSRINFTGEATDDTGLGTISVTISGPRKSNVTAFTDTSVSGKTKSLTSYYFDPANTAYAGATGVYSVVLRVQDRSSQVTTKTFPVTVR